MKKNMQIAFLAILLAGCSAVPIVLSPTPSNYPATPTVSTIPPTNTLAATSTSQATSSLTLQPISAPTITYDENARVKAKCAKVDQNHRAGNLGIGVVILEGRKIGSDHRYQRGFYFLNMKTGKTIDLIGKNDNLLNISVSPDRTLLSVDHVIFGDGDRTANHELLLIGADGKIQKTLPWINGWMSVVIWRDNQHLLINISGLDPDENKALKPARLLWLNPFTGQQRILIPNFPNLYDGYPLPGWGQPWGTSLSVYNPDFTRAIYLAEPGHVYMLWDMQKKKALFEWVNISKEDPPLWSPDGTFFLMTVNDASDTLGPYQNGLYLVDNNGTVLLPALSDIYAGTNISALDYFWSPSGRSVALLADASKGLNNEFKRKLLVLDIQTRRIVDYCVEFTPPMSDPSLIWSPDETQILLNDDYSPDHMHKRAILVDLAQGTAFPIAEDMVTTGWMKSP